MRFAQMKRTSWLVNVGRGAVVEEAALIEALRESRVRMGVRAAEETLRMLAGEKPENFVNPQAWEAATARRISARPTPQVAPPARRTPHR